MVSHQSCRSVIPVTVSSNDPILISIPLPDDRKNDECKKDEKICVSGDTLTVVADRDGCEVREISLDFEILFTILISLMVFRL